jgi:hypothetical protein
MDLEADSAKLYNEEFEMVGHDDHILRWNVNIFSNKSKTRSWYS